MTQSTQKVIFNWSGGKDSSLALHHYIQEKGKDSIDSLFTTINEKLQRITMHGVPVSLLKKQGKSIGIKVETIGLPEDISMSRYSEIMHERAQANYSDGIKEYVYGDINLQDLRDFRDKELSRSGIKAKYPLWLKNTRNLAQEFIDLGFKAIVVAVSGKVLDSSFAGREYDESFLKDLPQNVDPCGENGEFHTFVYDGPIFRESVPFTKGEITYKTYSPAKEDEDCFCCEKEPEKNWDKGFWFCDLQG